MEDWIKELTTDTIPERYRPIAELIGLENLIKLADYSSGDTLYIPTSEFFLRPIRDQRIRDDYRGSNSHDLAKKYNLSERRIREICEGVRPTPDWDEDENQLKLF
ncbi:Mor transcription activator family protein [Paenibacillus sp. NPDC057967]|uniref:Mor transcription activator family protein n=1 Tax=Paenibacillus sp. NPDC057967 TaxID=3346293 RepID=UPI0036DC257C